jgi:hypothetical protein
MQSSRDVKQERNRHDRVTRHGSLSTARSTASIDALEARFLFSATAGYLIAHLTTQPSQREPSYTVADHLTTGGAVLEKSGPSYTVASGTIAPGSPPPVGQVNDGTSGLHIILEEGPHLRANPQAAAAFEKAAQFLESIFSNPITLVVDAEIAALPTGVIGQTSSVEYHFGANEYDAVRNLLVNSAVGNESVVYNLPTSSQFNAALPANTINPFSVGGLTATRADLLALGVAPTELQNGPASAYDPKVKRDMSMTFSSNFPFDYNQADGISPGQLDFTGVVEHEIAHGLGFDSEVDTVDYLMSHPALGRTLYPTTMDLFRIPPGDGAIDFANAPRLLVPGNLQPAQVFYDGGVFNPAGIPIPGLALGDIPLSTGQFHGDGHQASHWKSAGGPGGTGSSVGAMNPTASFGQPVLWSDADTRALGLIGWDVAATATISGTVFNDLNHDGNQNPGETSIAGITVYLDENRDGIFEPSEPSVTTDGLGAYQFFSLTAGDYIVRAVPQSGTAPTVLSKNFDHVTLGPGQVASGLNMALSPAGLPSPWAGADIGSAAAPGTDAFAGGAFLLTSSGAGLTGVGDSLHYTYQNLQRDYSIVASLDTFQSVDGGAAAGLMVRQGIWQNSANVFLSITGSGGVQLTARDSAGARTRTVATYHGATPHWLKLVRRHNNVTAYVSADGVKWEFLGSAMIPLGQSAVAGLALASSNSARMAAATFSGVAIAP